MNPVLDGIDDHIAKLKSIEPWGYNTAYALSAKFNLHRNYAEFLLGKGRLRAKQINQILAGIEEDKKTAYDEKYAEELYQKFQNHEIEDGELTERLRGRLAGKEILVIAPGHSIVSDRDKIEAYIAAKHPIVFTANFSPEEYEKDYIFCSNAMRYELLKDRKGDASLLITSNLLDVCEKEKNILNYADLSFDEMGSCDNCVIMLIKLLIHLDAKEVVLAGFDGYRSEGGNYVHNYMASRYTKGQEENVRIRKYVAELKKKISVCFLTESIYEE